VDPLTSGRACRGRAHRRVGACPPETIEFPDGVSSSSPVCSTPFAPWFPPLPSPMLPASSFAAPLSETRHPLNRASRSAIDLPEWLLAAPFAGDKVKVTAASTSSPELLLSRSRRSTSESTPEGTSPAGARVRALGFGELPRRASAVAGRLGQSPPVTPCMQSNCQILLSDQSIRCLYEKSTTSAKTTLGCVSLPPKSLVKTRPTKLQLWTAQKDS
jgi:hypothetical protein